MDDSAIRSGYALDGLARLSLQRVGFRSTPHVLTADDRVNAYRDCVGVHHGNGTFRYAEYDPAPPTPEEVAEAGAFKYGF